MTRRNGTIWKVIGTVITLALIAAGIVAAYTEMGHQVKDNCEDIEAMQPEVQKNSEHRITDEVDTKYIKEKIEDIQATQEKILEEVRK